jgi:dTDP-4-dehydrorhamnose 3,5-epimerase
MELRLRPMEGLVTTMIFIPAPLKGVFVIDLEKRSDSRGFFARTYCAREFAEHGLKPDMVQCNTSFNHKAGVLRGMHYQVAPSTEAKLVRCTRGAIYDAIVDMRPDSPTYLQHFGIELSEDNRTALYVPEMFAHGYQTLRPNTEVFYQVSEFYAPGTERGMRHDDPAIGLQWPVDVSEISEKDASWPLLEVGVLR